MKYKSSLKTGVFFISLLFFAQFSFAQLLKKQESKGYMPFVIIENFSSEGCSSCPEADRFLGEVIRRSDSASQPVYVIDFHVDVWNKSGWVDKYSDSTYTHRQMNYIGKQAGIPMYTPQSFLNGILSVPGSDRKSIGSFIQKTLSKPSSHFLKTNAYQTTVDSVIIEYEIFGKIDSTVINFAIADNSITTKVTAGENAGKTLNHHNVVRVFKTEAVTVNKGKVYLAVPKGLNLKQTRIVTYVQNQNSWYVLAADQLVN